MRGIFLPKAFLIAASLLPGLCSAQTAALHQVSADCLPRFVAPTTYFGKEVPSTKTDPNAGVEALGFLDLSVFKKPVKTISGVDLNSGTTDEVSVKVDMQRLKYCGANFAFLRLTGRDDYVSSPPKNKKINPAAAWQLWNDAIAAGIEIYPYHFLYPSDDVLEGKIAGGFPYTDDRQQKLNAWMESEGHEQATMFINAYSNSHLHQQPPSKLFKQPYIALDIEMTLPGEFTNAKNPNAEHNRFVYSTGYAIMACAWISDVQKKYPNAKIILYTDMQMDDDYSVMNVDYTEMKCLKPYEVWMALPTVHGGHFAEDAGSAHTRTTARKFCYSENTKDDRCVIHQWTQRANIGLVTHAAKPPFLDLNRFNAEPIPWALIPQTPPKPQKAPAVVTHNAQK